MSTIDNLGFCTDCAMWIANRDDSGASPEWDRERLSRWDGWILSIGDGEPYFTWESCDGCRSHLGGDRLKGEAYRPTVDGPPPGTRHTPVFAREPRQYPRGTFGMTEEERAQHIRNQVARAEKNRTPMPLELPKRDVA